jgi:hypothetical protein
MLIKGNFPFCTTLKNFNDVETRLKGYKYFEIERDFFNKLGVLIDGDFKFGVLLLVFVRFLGGDTGNLYRNVFKNLFQFQNIYILSNGFPHLFGVEDPVKMSLSCFGPDINRMKRPPNNFLPNETNWRVDGELKFFKMFLTNFLMLGKRTSY